MIFLLIYFLFIIFYFFGVFAVLYHLKVYSLNSQFTMAIMSVFLLGSLVLFVVNLIMAIQIDWNNIEVLI